MSKRNEIYYKLYASDIFNLNPNSTKSKVTKPRKNYPTFESTKEDVFNIGKEGRIRRNKEKKDNLNNSVLSLSAAKRKQNYVHIYGSDIFNQKRALSAERRRGVKRLPNITNKTTLLNEIGDKEQYIKDLKYYTSQHRREKKEYDPDIYINKITPQERYYRQYYANPGPSVLEEEIINNKKNDDKKLNDYIHNKLNLKNEINKYNNVGADKKGKPGEIDYKEKRYFKQKHRLYDGKRRFVDINQFPQNSCRINKQIQMESHIFSNNDNNKNFDEEVKEINDRLELEKRKHYNTNILGQPIIHINKRNSIDSNRSLYGSANSRWRKTNLDWKDPESEIMFGNSFSNEKRNQTARQRKLSQLSDSENIDILSGLEKKQFGISSYQKEVQINNSGKKKLDEIIEEIPNLKEGEKLGIKMKASSLDCNDDELENKGKLLNDYYMNRNFKEKKEITGKVNDKTDRITDELKNYNTNDNIYHDYVITYPLKGNQFEKFDEYDIQKIFETRGIKTYDVHKNPFDKGNYNMINLKIAGNDKNNELYNKVKLVQEELKKQNYKINIEKGGNKVKKGKMVVRPGSKIGMLQENMFKGNEGSKFKIMPKELKARKGFAKQFDQVNYGYKKHINI